MLLPLHSFSSFIAVSSKLNVLESMIFSSCVSNPLHCATGRRGTVRGAVNEQCMVWNISVGTLIWGKPFLNCNNLIVCSIWNMKSWDNNSSGKSGWDTSICCIRYITMLLPNPVCFSIDTMCPLRCSFSELVEGSRLLCCWTVWYQLTKWKPQGQCGSFVMCVQCWSSTLSSGTAFGKPLTMSWAVSGTAFPAGQGTWLSCSALCWCGLTLSPVCSLGTPT